MGLSGLFKAPQRYEDIIGMDIKPMGRFRKLRLLLFFAGHPGEAERFQNDLRRRPGKDVNGKYYIDYSRKDLEKEMADLSKCIRDLREEINDGLSEQRKLKARVNEYMRMLNPASGGKGEGAYGSDGIV